RPASRRRGPRRSWIEGGRMVTPRLAIRLTSTLAVLALFALGPAAVRGAHAATITVNGNVSPATCTLIDAIKAANTDGPVAGGSGAAISGLFTGGGTDTIKLTVDVTLTAAIPAVGVEPGFAGLPAILGNIVINAQGHTIQRDPS